ncbi:MAG: transposase [Thermoanaerobaculia bacterium]|nr:MAG: transposase [Thermoanaerobaculia bacterium]MBZ0101015.1 transposase [Thermoanaerobaculia bacterium]
MKRVDLAYQAFFRRVRTGGPVGFPRFRAWRDFPGWTYTQTGWRWTPRQDGKHGRLALANVGSIRVRGGARTLGRMKTCTILRRAGKWYASIVLECHPERRGGTEALGLDWGVAHFATLSDGSTIENPRLLERDLEKLAAAQQVLARKKRGSRRRAKAKLAVHRLHEKIRNRRAHFLHQVSADLVARASFLATEKLATKNLTRSAAGTVEEPGSNVAQKAGLNRAILDTAPARFLALLRYKAKEAGVPFVEVDTKTAKPSQTCPACGAVAKKELAERVHRCSCGAELPRDQAAALVCLGVALTGDARGAWPLASLRSAGGRLRSETTACGGQGRGAAAPGGEVGSPPPPVCLPQNHTMLPVSPSSSAGARPRGRRKARREAVLPTAGSLRNDAMLPLSPGDVANDEDDQLLVEDA